MKWSKPQFENRRFGFEVTMYVYITQEQQVMRANSTMEFEASRFQVPAMRRIYHEKV